MLVEHLNSTNTQYKILMPKKEFDIKDLFNDKNLKTISTVLGIFVSMATITSVFFPKPQKTINYYYCD